ncbi:hypothetical protein HW555_009779 [Spodoptera exigua]|uniref:Uncharacterized protein n=1 Tax=Spodoptera exigua TaxID=7107 RepID=A0A835GBW5_SPOEX|nr:hypothetical protein HW555_009779 [Spodoptera exigua]
MERTFLLLANNIPSVNCHIPSHVSTPSSKNDQFCLLSESCVHDTIRVCGVMGDKKRTFLDWCDLLEFACDTNQSKQDGRTGRQSRHLRTTPSDLATDGRAVTS